MRRCAGVRSVLLAVALLVCVLNVPQCRAACTGLGCYTASQQSNTRAFLNALQANLTSTIFKTWIGTNFCGWSGITCASDIVAVDLGNRNVVGTLPQLNSTAYNTSQVVVAVLAFSNNAGLNGTLPSSWNTLSALIGIYAHNTSIHGTLPPSWANMTSLTILDVSTTGVSGTLPAEWAALTFLQAVNVSETSITGRLPQSWGAMSSLVDFRASKTSIGGPLPRQWSSLTKLQTLNLWDTAVAGYLPAVWSSLTSLVALEFGSTSISGTLPASWGAMHALEYFSVTVTPVYGTLPPEWGNMTSLQSISFAGSHIEGTIPDSWAAIEGLKYGAFDGTELTCCLPYTWLCKGGITAGDVGLTSAGSLSCPNSTEVCAQPSSSYKTSCPAYIPPHATSSSSVFPVWAVVVIAVGGAAATVAPLLLLWCWWMHRQGHFEALTSTEEREGCEGGQEDLEGSRAHLTGHGDEVEVPSFAQSNPLSASSSSISQ